MARGFHIVRQVEVSGEMKLVERVYELHGNEIILLANRSIRIAVADAADPKELVDEHERKTWPTLTGPFDVTEFESHSGTYHPSIARPLGFNQHDMLNPNAVSENKLAKTYRREHETLSNDIEQCFDVASPAEDNFGAFGTQFEKIIYFACVGVESLLSKIFEDNGLSAKNANMSDFVRLKSHLRLDEYSLSLVHYPWLPKLNPFAGWDSDCPSKSLCWFDAYNSMKHDKRQNLRKATMHNALLAAAAYYTVTFAVFGNQMFTGFLSELFFYQFETKPKWTAAERYFPSDDDTWIQRKLTI